MFRTYRTIEEKFLADFEKLERENDELREHIAELDAIIAERSRNITLDALVRAEGRRKVFNDAVNTWSVPDVGDRDFEAWCHVYTYEHALPKGVSIREFVDYFDDEYVTAYEGKIAEEVGA